MIYALKILVQNKLNPTSFVFLAYRIRHQSLLLFKLNRGFYLLVKLRGSVEPNNVNVVISREHEVVPVHATEILMAKMVV
jgi:hypothetical protein